MARSLHPVGADADFIAGDREEFNAEFSFFDACAVFPECHGLTFGDYENRIRIG